MFRGYPRFYAMFGVCVDPRFHPRVGLDVHCELCVSSGRDIWILLEHGQRR